MPLYIALLRGINVGGSGLLAMKDLASLCSRAGFQSVRTYIQSGNVLFETSQKEPAIRACLEKALSERIGKQVDVMVRSPAEMRAILAANPFPKENPAKVAVAFLSAEPPKDLLDRVIAPGGEQVKTGKREIYVFYPDGMGRSKLKLPLDKTPTTVRNINTVAKLVALTEA